MVSGFFSRVQMSIIRAVFLSVLLACCTGRARGGVQCSAVMFSLPSLFARHHFLDTR
eukprot:m.511252 g.511252  ORF g.511252 m.511252 type:complete len:57 (-) comp100632_c0_seq1:56-226(-)